MTQATQAGALVERVGNVMVITINRPEARNAVNSSVSIGVGGASKRRRTIRGAGDRCHRCR